MGQPARPTRHLEQILVQLVVCKVAGAPVLKR